MKHFKLLLTWLFALLLIAAGINHLANPVMYAAFIPNWLPLVATNYFTALVECGLGAGLLITRTRHLAAIGIVLLMIFFLPFHTVDAYREHPAIGTHLVAWIRLAMQFVLIYWAWLLVPRAR